MLNLLSTQSKKELRAARFNLVLRNYYVMLLATVALFGGVFGMGLFITNQQKDKYDMQKSTAQQEAAKYDATNKAAEKFSKDLAIDKVILASDVRFSKLITDIAGAVPSCVILGGLTISATNLTGPLAITGRACSYNDAVRLKNSLETSPLFENAKLVNITATDPGTAAQADPIIKKYPVIVTASAQLTKTAAQGAK